MSIGVIIFCYDRPEHIKRLLVSIVPRLVHTIFLIQDGLGEVEREREHKIVTEIIKGYAEKHSNVKLILRENNYGLRDNILSGIDEIAKKTSFLLILEDDLAFDDNNFELAVKYIRRHERDDVHFQLFNEEGPPRSSLHMSCWGWAIKSETWPGSQKLAEVYASASFLEISEFFRLHKIQSRQILLNLIGLRKTWAIFWWFYIYKHNVKIETVDAKVTNTGLEGSGVHHNNILSKRNRFVKDKFLNALWIIFAVFSYLIRKRVYAGWLLAVPRIELPCERVNLMTDRIGSHFDGGYPVPKMLNFAKVKNILSLGLHDNFEFEREITHKCKFAGVKMYDGSISVNFLAKRTIINLLRQRWSRVSATLWSFSVYLLPNVELNKRFVKAIPVCERDVDVKDIFVSKQQGDINILKLDIEGDEYEVLPILNSGNSFDLILMELHHFNDDAFQARLIDLLDWSNYLAYFVNVNNFATAKNCSVGAIELGLIRKNLVEKYAICAKKGGYASSMNTPNLNRVVEFSA